MKQHCWLGHVKTITVDGKREPRKIKVMTHINKGRVYPYNSHKRGWH